MRRAGSIAVTRLRQGAAVAPLRTGARGVRTQRGRVLQKALGQHLLVNRDSLRGIIDAAELLPTDHVLEVGPGTGNLTVLLLERAAAVTAVELDSDLHALLEDRVRRIGLSDRLHAIHGDFLKTPLPKTDALVANVPYQISSPLVRRLFSLPADVAPSRSVLLLQKEFADRMVAQPGTSAYSRLSVTCALFADVRMALQVPPSHFRPPPKVDSAVVVVRPRALPAAFEDVDFHEFESMLRACFSGKNKTLRSLLLRRSFAARALYREAGPVKPSEASSRRATSSGRSGLDPAALEGMRERLAAVLERADVGQLRPNAMPLEAFLALYEAASQLGVRWTEAPMAFRAEEEQR